MSAPTFDEFVMWFTAWGDDEPPAFPDSAVPAIIEPLVPCGSLALELACVAS